MILANVLLTRTEPIGSRVRPEAGPAGRPGRRDPGPPGRDSGPPGRDSGPPGRDSGPPGRGIPRPLNHSHGPWTSRQTTQQTLTASRES
jgi:hypothetical protein